MLLSSYRCHIYFHEIRSVTHSWNNFWKHFSTALKPWNAMNVSGNLDCVHSLFIDEETKNKMLKESKRRRMRASQWLREREKWEDWRKLKERNCDFRVFIIKIKTLMAGNRDHGARFTRKWMTIAESISLDVHLPGKRSCFLVLWQFQIELLFFFSLCLSLLFKKKEKRRRKKYLIKGILISWMIYSWNNRNSIRLAWVIIAMLKVFIECN